MARNLHFTDLPERVIWTILKYLDNIDVFSFRLACQRFSRFFQIYCHENHVYLRYDIPIPLKSIELYPIVKRNGDDLKTSFLPDTFNAYLHLQGFPIPRPVGVPLKNNDIHQKVILNPLFHILSVVFDSGANRKEMKAINARWVRSIELNFGDTPLPDNFLKDLFDILKTWREVENLVICGESSFKKQAAPRLFYNLLCTTLQTWLKLKHVNLISDFGNEGSRVLSSIPNAHLIQSLICSAWSVSTFNFFGIGKKFYAFTNLKVVDLKTLTGDVLPDIFSSLKVCHSLEILRLTGFRCSRGTLSDWDQLFFYVKSIRHIKVLDLAGSCFINFLKSVRYALELKSLIISNPSQIHRNTHRALDDTCAIRDSLKNLANLETLYVDRLDPNQSALIFHGLLHVRTIQHLIIDRVGMNCGQMKSIAPILSETSNLKSISVRISNYDRQGSTMFAQGLSCLKSLREFDVTFEHGDEEVFRDHSSYHAVQILNILPCLKSLRKLKITGVQWDKQSLNYMKRQIHKCEFDIKLFIDVEFTL